MTRERFGMPGSNFDDENLEITRTVDSFFACDLNTRILTAFLRRYPGAKDEILVSVGERLSSVYGKDAARGILGDIEKKLKKV